MESQPTSVEARPCCESGEELAAEMFLPLGHDLQKLPSRFEATQPFIATRFLTINMTANAMTKRIRIARQKHLTSRIQRTGESSQPRQKSPHQTRSNHRLMSRTIRTISVAGGIDRIADALPLVTNDRAIRLVGILKIPLSLLQQERSCKTFIRQYESRDSR